MPVFTYDMGDGESGSIYAANIFEAEEEVYALFEQHPERMTEET